MRIVCMAPGTTRKESVAGLYRNEMPSPTCSGSPRPRRVCTTNALGGTTTVFQRPNPVTRTSTAAVPRSATAGPAASLAGAPGGGGGGGIAAATAAGRAGAAARRTRRSCASCSCCATTWSR